MGEGVTAKVSCLPNLSLLTLGCYDKDRGIKQLVEDRTYSSYTSGSQGITERNQGRSSRHRILKQTPRTKATHWLTPRLTSSQLS